MSDSGSTDAKFPSAHRSPAMTFFPPSPPIETQTAAFWDCGPGWDELSAMDVAAPSPAGPTVLEQLGPSPFERGGFPVIGFLATTYERVSRYACQRLGRPPQEG